MLKPSYKIPALPPPVNLESVPVLKALGTANRALAEFKGRAASIPNQGILIDTLALQEAKASSEIENIVTTQDELFQADLQFEGLGAPAAKEVALYRDALKLGYSHLCTSGGPITNRTLIEMFRLLKRRDDGFRVSPGTALKNDLTGEVVYVPLQDANEIQAAMTTLERFINEDERSPLDPLIKMALIHHQFESIHPFPDGNGRIGRILNVLCLTRAGLLETPILYLSRHITQTKADYYRHLQAVRTDGAWEEWVLYMLEAVASTAKTTLALVEGMRGQMANVEKRLREELPALYSQDLLNNLFRHPYTRIEFVVNDLHVSRQTASKYLDQLAEKNFVAKQRSGRNNYYVNTDLVRLFLDVSGGTIGCCSAIGTVRMIPIAMTFPCLSVLTTMVNISVAPKYGAKNWHQVVATCRVAGRGNRETSECNWLDLREENWRLEGTVLMALQFLVGFAFCKMFFVSGSKAFVRC